MNELDKDANPLNVQVGGDHYKKLGAYQPWEIAGAQFTSEELRGFMKGTVMSYLAREKGGAEDIEKAMHTIQLYLAVAKKNNKLINHISPAATWARDNC